MYNDFDRLEKLFKKPVSKSAGKKYNKGIKLVFEALKEEVEAQNQFISILKKVADNNPDFKSELEKKCPGLFNKEV